MCVFLLTNRHQPNLPQYHPQAGWELLVPASFTPELVGESCRILHPIYRLGYKYVKAGVLCLELVSDGEKQVSLFRPVDPAREEKARRLMVAVDQLNLWGGRGTVRAASMGTGEPRGWQMRRNRTSPSYTTRLKDAPRATM